MFGLPENTNISVPTPPASAIIKRIGLSESESAFFMQDVKKISVTNEITEKHIAVKDIKSIKFICIEVTRENYNHNVISKVAKAFKGHVITVVQFANLSCVLLNVENKAIHSSWEPNLSFTLKGLTLDTVWENIVKAVGQIDVEPGLTLSHQIELNTLRESTEKKIAAIEKKARAEKQPRKKFELAQQKKSMEQELIDKIAAMKAEYQQQVALAYNIQNK